MKELENNINKISIDSVSPAMLINLEALQARYDTRQSFYKKAYIGEYIWSNGDKALYLKSYDTIVACIYKNTLRIYGKYSQTTTRHQVEFIKQFTNHTVTSKDIKTGVFEI